MTTNPILEEIYAARRQLLADHSGDIHAYVQEATRVEDYVALVLRVVSVQLLHTQKSEPYLQETGVDMDGRASTPLHFWRYEDGELKEGRKYILRGLKVVAEQYWDAYTEGWVPRPDGQHSLECSYMTAVEDVTDNDAVSSCFW